MNNKIIEIEILRYRPEVDKVPFPQLFEVPYNSDMSVLEALQYIKDHLDSWKYCICCSSYLFNRCKHVFSHSFRKVSFAIRLGKGTPTRNCKELNSN